MIIEGKDGVKNYLCFGFVFLEEKLIIGYNILNKNKFIYVFRFYGYFLYMFYFKRINILKLYFVERIFMVLFAYRVY